MLSLRINMQVFLFAWKNTKVHINSRGLVWLFIVTTTKGVWSKTQFFRVRVRLYFMYFRIFHVRHFLFYYWIFSRKIFHIISNCKLVKSKFDYISSARMVLCRRIIYSLLYFALKAFNVISVSFASGSFLRGVLSFRL